MKNILLPFLISISVFLTACGGGGDSGNVNSSYSKTILQSGITYICKSESAANQCENGNCSKCEIKDTGNSLIAAACLVSIENQKKIYHFTNIGCVANMANTSVTGLCSGTTLKLLTGKDISREYLIEKGVSFAGGGQIIFNNEIVTCD